MSTADLMLQTFVIILCMLACWHKWGKPAWNRWGGTIGHPFRMRSHYHEVVRDIPDASAPNLGSPEPPLLDQLFETLPTTIAESSSSDVGISEPIEVGIDTDESTEEDLAEDEADVEESDEETEGRPETSRGGLQSGKPGTSEARPVHLRSVAPALVVQPPADSRWLQWMSRVLKGAIHLIVMGQSDAGKTTVLQVFVESLVAEGIPVVVCDPDAAAGDWPGTEIHGGGDDFEGINDTLAAVQAEARARRQQRAEGQRTFDPLWVVLDEYADIKSECALANGVVENLLRRARKLNIHLVIGVQDTQVKTMGFERKSELLNNARIVSLTIDAQKRRFASIDDEGKIAIPQLVPQQGAAQEGSSLPIIESPIETQDFDDEEPETELNGNKDDKIREMLIAGKSYGYISQQLRVATTRISKVKKELAVAVMNVYHGG